MRSRPITFLLALALVATACSDGESTPSTDTSTTSTSTTTTTLIATTSSTVATTTTVAPITTTTAPIDTTTTTAAPEETTTTTRGSPTTTTTLPPENAIDALIPYAGIFRQPTTWDGFLDFGADGVIRAGYNISNLEHFGTWTYDEETDYFTFTGFDFGAGCDGASGIYERERAFGGGRRIILVDDPCADRVAFIVQPGSECMCFVYNRVEFPAPDDEG